MELATGTESLTLYDWLTTSGLHPEREKEATDEIKANAEALLTKVNPFLDELGWDGSKKLSSGFRPSEVNAATPHAAKHSGHESGHALDVLDDKQQSLCKLVMSRPDLLKKHGLMMEDIHSTKGKFTNWCHLDDVDRPDRPSRTFLP